VNSEPTTDSSTRLTEWRRSMERCIPHPALYTAARSLVGQAYMRGDFGNGDRTPEYLEAKARNLADLLEGCFEDWQIEVIRSV
jgi:hypothetical protein